jgi:hypothetical protein
MTDIPPLTSRIRIGSRVLNSTVDLVSIWCLFLSRTRENCEEWREPIEMCRSQYSCGFQRMSLYWRELAKVGGVESLTLRYSPSHLVTISTNYINKSGPCKRPIHEFSRRVTKTITRNLPLRLQVAADDERRAQLLRPHPCMRRLAICTQGRRDHFFFNLELNHSSIFSGCSPK